MGLDMYLTKKTYIGAVYKHRNVTGAIDIKIDGKPIKIDFNKVSYINEQAGYWRKANHIHNWFVENVQDGSDDCREYYVTLEQLEELLSICKRIKQDHSLAESLLPTKEGFFFGGAEYNEWYFDDIDTTIEILEPIISLHQDPQSPFPQYYYRASW